ncbi:MAG: hypothetical protein LBQ82_06900 [Treponema sp.]|nr:hypothetical protein [Treponema sp.]
MSDITVENGEGRFTRSIFIKVLIFSGLIVLSAAAMRPVQAAISQAMSHIRTSLIARIETATGMEIQYSSIRPSLFGSFDIRSLRLTKNNNAFLSISRVRISFSLADLLRGKKNAVRSIEIERPSISLDTEKDGELLIFLKSLSNSDTNFEESLAQIAEFFPEQPVLLIRNFNFSLIDGGTFCRIGEMDIDINGDGSRLFLESKLRAELRYSDLKNKIYTVKTDVSVNGECPANLDEGRAEMAFTSFTVLEQEKKRNGLFFQTVSSSTGNNNSFLDIRPFGFEFLYKNENLTVSTLGENNKYSGLFNYNIETGNISAETVFNDFIPSALFAFSGAYKNINDFLLMTVTGGASFNYEKTGAMRYNVNLNGADVLRKGKDLAVNLHGNEKSITVDDVHFYAPETAEEMLFYGNFGFSGRMGFADFTPSGKIFFDNFSISGNDSINAVLQVSNSGNEIHVSAETVSFGKAAFNNLDVYLYPSDGDLGVLASVFCENEGELSMEAMLNYAPRQLDASLSLNTFSFNNFVEILKPFSNNANSKKLNFNTLKEITITSDLFVSTDFDKLVYNAPSINIKYDKIDGQLSLSGTDRQFTLSEGIFTKNNTDFFVSANVNFSNPNDLVFTFNANFLDLSWNLEGNILDMSTLIISDPNGLHAYGNVSSLGAVSGYVEGVDFPIPFDGHPAYLNFYTSMRYDSRDFWAVDVAHFNARGINSLGDDGSLSVSGTLDQDGASFRNLFYRDQIGDLTGGVDFSWDSDFSYLQFFANITDGREAGENYNAEGMLKNDHFNVNASITDMRVDRFTGSKGKILLNGNADIMWDSAQSFNARLDLTSLYANMNGNEVNASASLLFDNDELAVNELLLTYADFKAYMPDLRLNRIENFAATTIYASGLFSQNVIEGKIELNTNFNNIDSWMDYKNALDSFNGSIKMENFYYKNVRQQPFAFVFARSDGELSVSGGPGDMLRLEMDKEGNFFTSLSNPMPIHSTIVGKYKDGIIDAHCNDFFMDISGLWSMLPNQYPATIAGGYITAQVDIRGQLFNPEFFGKAKGTSFCIQVPDYLGDDIKLDPFFADLEGYELAFNQVPASVGGGGGLVDGWFLFENWIPDNFGLVIKIPRERPIPYKVNIGGFVADGDASGLLNLTMENSTFDVSGDLFANNTEMSLEAEDAKNADNNSSSSNTSTVINMTITTGSVVEFLWPNKNMPILRANPEMGTVLNIFADTLTMQYTLNSDIKIRSGELFYFDRSFYIRQGNLIFRENEQQFNPRISARAEVRDRTDSGPVSIMMIIENEPLLSFSPRFEANPVLTQVEIYSLLGQNLYAAGGENMADSQRFLLSSTTDIIVQLAASNDFLAQFVTVRQLERRVRNILHLDMFSVRTRFLQNAIAIATVGAVTNANDTGQNPVDRNSGVGNYFDKTSVFVGKYVGQKMFIQGMLSLRYDENYLNMGGIRFEPDIGVELQSPLFNIRWDFFPYHPENLWLNDHSITLLWSKSF